MKEKKITLSFLIPSCRGPEVLDKTVFSAINTADDPSVVDFVVKVDTEKEQNNYQSFFDAKGYPSKVSVFFDSITGHMNGAEMMNQLAKKSSGDLLWLFGDDFLIESNNWQSQFANIVGQYPDMIFAINHRHHPWSPVPVVTKKWVKLFGYVAIGFVDSWIQHVALGAERYIQVHDPITVDHYLESIKSGNIARLNKHQARKIKSHMRGTYRDSSYKITTYLNKLRNDNVDLKRV